MDVMETGGDVQPADGRIMRRNAQLKRHHSTDDILGALDPLDHTVTGNLNNNTRVNKKLKKHQLQSKLRSQHVSDNNSAVDDAIEFVATQGGSQSIAKDVYESDCSDIHKQMNDLKQTINRQNVIINTLVNRLNFILSMFSIDEVSMSMPTAVPNNVDDSNKGITEQEDQWPGLPPHQLTSIIDGDESSTSYIDNAKAPGKVVASTSAKQLYSRVTGLTQSQQPQKQLSQFRQSLVAAVYIDQRDKDSRSSSFIVSGLPSSAVHSDKYIVTELCMNEFNIQVDIVSTKRLGKASPSTDTVQPLLVHVKNVDHAKLIISSARHLRQSIASLVRDNVYINPNLTKAEASAAYELRCRHREAANRRSTAGGRSVGHPAHQQSANIEGVLPSSKSVSDSSLNATVPPFMPVASTS